MENSCGWLLPCLLFGALVGTASAGTSVNLQVGLDPSRPVGLYEGPQTYRRDARGRPFKSIIIRASPSSISNTDSNSIRDRSTSVPTTTTEPSKDGYSSTSTTASPLPRAASNQPFKSFVITSKPFGLGSADSNFIRDRSTTTTTTTASPLVNGKAPVTIPFFSISCTVGTSCSQIISARQTLTPKPTFKPYTQEEISKFKGTLGSAFPSSALTVNLGLRSSSTTAKPSSWRVKTTTTQSYATTTPSPMNRQQSSDEQENKRWKWPSEEIDRNAENRNYQQENLNTRSTIPPAKLFTWTPQLNEETNSVGPIQKGKPSPYADYQQPSTTTTHRTPTAGWMSLLAATFNGLQQHMKPSPESYKQPTVQKQTSPSIAQWVSINDGLSNTVAQDQVFTSKWAPENQREVVSMKGNKISLITGSSNREKVNKPAPVSSMTLPPEVSVSSHVIGLRVKPKSLNHYGFVENIQGVAVETDGQNVNLSDLIMRQPLPSRPPRYLTWAQDRQRHLSARNLPQEYHSRQYYHQQDDPRHHQFSSVASEWRPMFFAGQ